MNFIKKNFVLLLAFSLPVLLIVGVALSIYLPSQLLSTKYDFVYALCTNGTSYTFGCQDPARLPYQVQNGALVVTEIDPKQDLNGNGVPDINERYRYRLFLHNTQKNESTEITLDQGKTLQLSGLLTSPDGLTISDGYSGGSDFFLFGGSSTYGHYLSKGKAKSRLNLVSGADWYSYDNNFQFIGWVLPGRK